MDLFSIKIAQIKNIDLIYLYSTDSIFNNKENKYLGIKVVYNNNKDYLSLDYKDNHFGELIKHVITRYQEEKDSKNIILLGPLTKDLIENNTLLENITNQESFNKVGLTLFNTNKEKLLTYEPYIKEILKDILSILKSTDLIEVTNIDGYNMKYNIDYKIGNVKQNIRAIFSLNENTLTFKLGVIEGFQITGKIINNYNKVDIEFASLDKEIEGYYKYDASLNMVYKQIIKNGVSVLYRETPEVITPNEVNIINHYLKIFNINWDTNFLKTNDNNYIFGKNNQLIEKEESILSENHGMQIYITKDKVKITYKIKNTLSKYNNRINTDLDYLLTEITLSIIDIDNQKYILVEKNENNKLGNKFDYMLLETNDIDLTKQFNIKGKTNIDDVTSLYDIRRKVLQNKKGVKV